jgi:hypothetical protein
MSHDDLLHHGREGLEGLLLPFREVVCVITKNGRESKEGGHSVIDLSQPSNVNNPNWLLAGFAGDYIVTNSTAILRLDYLYLLDNAAVTPRTKRSIYRLERIDNEELPFGIRMTYVILFNLLLGRH